jgi:CheY-like chemotaxis protein
MDGFKATTRIRKLERQIGDQQRNTEASSSSSSPEAPPHIPILALTASATTDYQLKCFKQGMDDFLTKVLSSPPSPTCTLAVGFIRHCVREG